MLRVGTIREEITFSQRLNGGQQHHMGEEQIKTKRWTLRRKNKRKQEKRQEARNHGRLTEAVLKAADSAPPWRHPAQQKCVSGSDIRDPAHKMVEITLEMEDFYWLCLNNMFVQVQEN